MSPVVKGKTIPIEFLREREFVRTLDAACKREIGTSFSDVSILDRTPLHIEYKGATYETSVRSITERVKGNSTFTEANTLIKAREFLSEIGCLEYSGRVTAELLKDNGFMAAINEASIRTTGKNLSEVSSKDSTVLTIEYGGKVYQATIHSITQRIKDSPEFADITTQGAAKQHIVNTLKLEEVVPLTDELLRDPGFVNALNDKCIYETGKTISDVPVSDRTVLAVEYNGKVYHTPFDAITGRISRSSQFHEIGSQAEARLYLSTLIGLDAPIKRIKQANNIERTRGHLAIDPTDPQFITAVNDAYMRETGKDISQAVVFDNTLLHIPYGDKVYETTLSSLWRSLARSPSFSGSGRTEAREYFVNILGLKVTGKVSDDMLKDPGFIRALNEACVREIGRDLPMPSADNDDRRTIRLDYKGKTYETNVSAIIRRISSSKKFSSIKTPDEARSHIAAILGIEVSAKIDINLLKSQGFVSALNEACIKETGRDLSTVQAEDATILRFSYNGRSYETRISALTKRIRSNPEFNWIENVAAARDYLELIRQGMRPDETRTLLENRANVPPEVIKTSSFLEFLDGLMNAESGKGIRDTSVMDTKRYTIAYDRQTYGDSFNAILNRVSRNCGLNGLSEARQYIEIVKKGMSHEEALTFIKSGQAKWEALDNIMAKIEELNLENLVALLGSDPIRLKIYLMLTRPDLAEIQLNDIVKTSFKGLVTRLNSREKTYLGYDVKISQPTIITKFVNTTENTVKLEGEAPGATHIYVAGSWNRRITVDRNGKFSAKIPLKVAELNEFRIFAINANDLTRSEIKFQKVRQLSPKPDDVEVLIQLLSKSKKEILLQLQNDEKRTELLIRELEQLTLKKFSRSFEEGEMHLQLLLAKTGNPVIKGILDQVLDNFRRVNETVQAPLERSEHLFFFQKYCVYRVVGAMRDGLPGIILANDPGLGKTVVALVATEGKPAVIISPNNVVSTWVEQGRHFIGHGSITGMQFMSRAERIKVLKAAALRGIEREPGLSLRIATNVQFLQGTHDEERFTLINNVLNQNPSNRGILVLDEAHWTTNLDTKQTQGLQMLNPGFLLLVTATPFKNPVTVRRIMGHLLPDDSRFSSDAAFRRSFDENNPNELIALHHMISQHVVRFRKEDVFEEYDPRIPIKEQTGRLPRKEFMPEVEFTTTREQAEAVYLLFKDWAAWTDQYGHYLPPNDSTSKLDNLYSGNSLAKGHALRHIMNDPLYVGEDAASPKHAEVEGIVRKAVEEEGRKTIIFCRYLRQVEEYARLLEDYKPAIFAGAGQGEESVKDEKGNVMKFEANEAGWVLENGYPKPNPKGEPMSALDYERITFMNAPDRKVIICTYGTGGVGVTLNAAKAVVFDDLPDDFVQLYQAEDRAHRIDSDITRTHHDVKYYRVLSRYPEDFLEDMKQVKLRKNSAGAYEDAQPADSDYEDLPSAYTLFFEQGTMDQVTSQKLDGQRVMYKLLIDGIADESIFAEENWGSDNQLL